MEGLLSFPLPARLQCWSSTLWPIPLRGRLRHAGRGGPGPASFGQVVRHRLNRGGDRQLHRALPTIVLLRQVHHGPTRASTSRRIAQGKSQREIRRCRKRTVARQLYRLLERTATNPPSS
jgi:transposase